MAVIVGGVCFLSVIKPVALSELFGCYKSLDDKMASVKHAVHLMKLLFIDNYTKYVCLSYTIMRFHTL